MFVSKDAQVGIYIPHWCGHKEPNDQYIYIYSTGNSRYVIPMNLWLFDVMCVCIYIYLCVHIWNILRTLETKSKISNLYSPRVLVMLLYMITEWLSNTNATEDFPSRNAGVMRSKWRSCYILHRVISSFSWWFPSNPRVAMSGGWNEYTTNRTSSAAQLVQVLNTSTVTWRVY